MRCIVSAFENLSASPCDLAEENPQDICSVRTSHIEHLEKKTLQYSFGDVKQDIQVRAYLGKKLYLAGKVAKSEPKLDAA
jgi:hypothetical protein